MNFKTGICNVIVLFVFYCVIDMFEFDSPVQFHVFYAQTQRQETVQNRMVNIIAFNALLLLGCTVVGQGYNWFV